jgi:predicted nucleic acid-binding protein
VLTFVSNSSPLIAFERLERLELLHAMTGRVIIPPAVRREVFPGVALLPWLHQRSISQPLTTQLLAPRLGPGEREAIALALELRPSFVLLDDLPARRAAEELGLTVLGTVGLLLLAKERSLVPSVQPLLDQLIALDFRVSQRLYQAALTRAGE